MGIPRLSFLRDTGCCMVISNDHSVCDEVTHLDNE